MSIYQAVYRCRKIGPTGMTGYNDVVLGLEYGNGSTDILIKGTLARFVVGKEYIINIMEKP